MSIESIVLENVSALPQTNFNSTTPSRQCHAVFNYFYWMIANKMLPLLLHTARVSFNCSKIKIIDNIFE